MDSLVSVEKEVDKAIDSFETFYQGVDDDIDRALELVLKNMNEIMKSNFSSYFDAKNHFILSLNY